MSLGGAVLGGAVLGGLLDKGGGCCDVELSVTDGSGGVGVGFGGGLPGGLGVGLGVGGETGAGAWVDGCVSGVGLGEVMLGSGGRNPSNLVCAAMAGFFVADKLGRAELLVLAELLAARGEPL